MATAPILPILQRANKVKKKNGSPDLDPGPHLRSSRKYSTDRALAGPVEKMNQIQQHLCLEREQFCASRGDLLAVEFGVL